MTTKLSNPKDIIGSDKIPLHLWPETATALGSLALLEGALKYGRCNWRAVGVRASIYTDAAKRHLNKWFEGEDIDTDSGLPHLAHALACIAILVDADACGRLNDDRQIAGGYINMLRTLTPHVKRLKEMHSSADVKHYTIEDNKWERIFGKGLAERSAAIVAEERLFLQKKEPFFEKFMQAIPHEQVDEPGDSYGCCHQEIE